MWLKASVLSAALLLAATACGSSSPDAADTPAPGRSSGAATGETTTSSAGAEPDAPSSAAGSPGAAPTVGDLPPVCSLLTSADRKRLVGKSVDRVIPVSGVGEGYTCRWVEADSLAPSTLVQVTAMPSSTWAQTLPSALEQMEQHKDQFSAADRKELVQAQKMVSGGRLDAKQACSLFTTLSEIGGAPQGADRTVNLLPVGQSTGVSAQTCTAGRFTSVVFARPGLQRSEQLTNLALAVLARAHQRSQRLP
ncbi:hypothetical protein [Segeticoccus rhizosphaerae]|jgi:hypothetical protein|uniref:hypothetical protein n=1 Tax=Segeticoccus rhizosphaerae TaxID=1104777 RepID=UPI0010C138EB|nr:MULTISPECIES: hypothetical protein [Intrasporangiaceae]